MLVLPIVSGCGLSPSCFNPFRCSPGAGGDGGKQGQCDQSVPRRGAGGGPVCVCPPVPPHRGAGLLQPAAGPGLPAAAAEQTSGT